MLFARVFRSGNSQAVRLPKEFRFDVNQVEIFRRGDEIVLRALPANGEDIFDALTRLPPDFMEFGRQDTPPQDRENF
jgi:antitoxin VapB